MSEIQDSAACIAADMRQLADDIAAGRAIVGQSVWRSYADRVEKIGTGNIAKLRETVETIRKYIEVNTLETICPGVIEVWCDEALAAPARQCDRYTGEDLDRDVDDAYARADKDLMLDYNREDLPIRWLLSTSEQVEAYKKKFKEELDKLGKARRGEK